MDLHQLYSEIPADYIRDKKRKVIGARGVFCAENFHVKRATAREKWGRTEAAGKE